MADNPVTASKVMLKASKNEIPDLPAPKVFPVSPKTISYEKETKLRSITRFGLDILSAGGIQIVKGVEKVSGVDGFTFISSQTVVEGKKGRLIEILFHPLREEANPDTAQKDPVVRFFFKGRSCNDKNWRILSFVDHETWLRELEKLIPKSKQLIEAAKSRREAACPHEKRRAEVVEPNSEEKTQSGETWLNNLKTNNEKQWEGRLPGPALVSKAG